jgi:hypothetical protein
MTARCGLSGPSRLRDRRTARFAVENSGQLVIDLPALHFAASIASTQIERSLEQTKKGGLRLKSPKTKNSRRNLSISPWLVAELRAHRKRQREGRLSLGLGDAPEESLVFARWDGETGAPHWLTQKFALSMDRLKIDCTLHALRHTHVSQLIAAGMDILTISRRLGHASAASLFGYTATCSRIPMLGRQRLWKLPLPRCKPNKNIPVAIRWQLPQGRVRKRRFAGLAQR